MVIFNWRLHKTALYLLLGISTLVLFGVSIPGIPLIGGKLFGIPINYILGAINIYAVWLFYRILNS